MTLGPGVMPPIYSRNIFCLFQCREMLRLRQQLMAEDVKVDETFFTACKNDIVQNQCITGPVENQDWARSAILLCLENAVKRGNQ